MRGVYAKAPDPPGLRIRNLGVNRYFIRNGCVAPRARNQSFVYASLKRGEDG